MHRKRDYFWPLILIGVGVLILLANLNIVELDNLYKLVNLWPLLLIGAGINLMFRRQFEWLGLVLGVVLLAIIVVFLIYAPQIDMPTFMTPKNMKSESYSEVIGSAESYKLDLNTDVGHITLTGDASQGDLVDIEMQHRSKSYFDVSGSDHKDITLNLKDKEIWFQPNNWFGREESFVNVALDPSLPAEIFIDHSSGNIDLLLEEFELLILDVELSSGNIDVALPAGSYPINLDISSGNMFVDFSTDMNLIFDAEISSGSMTLDLVEYLSGNIDLDISSGSITLNIPAGLGVQIEGEISSGSVSYPDNFEQVSGSVKTVGEDGVWENEAYDPSGQNLVITFDISSGKLTINTIDERENYEDDALI